MAPLTLTQAQRLLLGIITSVEAGYTTPSDAVTELKTLKDQAASAGLLFKADYTEEEFQKLRENFTSTYESSTPYEEPSYESSSSY